MNVFDLVKDNITARQVAEAYGLKVNRYGMSCCPFHDDRSPSFKVDRRYYCFGCGETGDAIDFVAKHFGLSCKDAAIKICEDFGLDYKGPPGKAKPKPTAPQKSDEQIFKETEQHIFRVLSDYYHQLKKWKTEYAPKTMDEEWHPYFTEALQETDHIEYLLDTLLNGDVHDRASLISDYGKKVVNIERRLQELKQRRNAESERSFSDLKQKQGWER